MCVSESASSIQQQERRKEGSFLSLVSPSIPVLVSVGTEEEEERLWERRERERMVRAQDVVFAHVKMAPKEEEEPIFLSLTSCALMPEMGRRERGSFGMGGCVNARPIFTG